MSARTHRFRVGTFDVATILDGVVDRTDGATVFGANRAPEEVAALARAHGLDLATLPNPFVPTLVRTGEATVLVDTGFGAARRPEAGKLVDGLASIGVEPGDIDVVLLTHLHADHVGGLMEAGVPVFERARVLIGRRELAYWTETTTAPAVEANVRPLLDRIERLDDGDAVVPGVTVEAAFGHTPGHLIVHLESGAERLVLTADTANHPVLALTDPDWHFKMDVDPAQASATRRRVFDRLAADGTPFIGHHMPFPALGRVERQGPGYRWLPAEG